MYHSSQPWPFPSQLMLGCIAYATSTQVTLVDKELEVAKWFDFPPLQGMLQNKHPEGYFGPPPYAIAHQLVKHVCLSHTKL
jgi:NAD+ diphosphatase